MRRFKWWVVFICIVSAQPVVAAVVTAMIVDSTGAPVGDAVIALLPAANGPAGPPPKPVALDQVKKQFVPHVLVIEVGTTLFFPNSDNIRHQVYSFSDAKRFELKLYSGKTAAPVLFDKPGVVVMGCNIHDWMSAYVYVVPTPYFAMTDKLGHAEIKVPLGNYTVNTWHPRLARGREPMTAQISVSHDEEPLHEALVLAAVDEAPGTPPDKP